MVKCLGKKETSEREKKERRHRSHQVLSEVYVADCGKTHRKAKNKKKGLKTYKIKGSWGGKFAQNSKTETKEV